MPCLDDTHWWNVYYLKINLFLLFISEGPRASNHKNYILYLQFINNFIIICLISRVLSANKEIYLSLKHVIINNYFIKYGHIFYDKAITIYEFKHYISLFQVKFLM